MEDATINDVVKTTGTRLAKIAKTDRVPHRRCTQPSQLRYAVERARKPHGTDTGSDILGDTLWQWKYKVLNAL